MVDCELMKTTKRLVIDIRIAHYPPYCSKWNPIEHRLFLQIIRAWSGTVFNTIKEASDMAAKTTTKTRLAVECERYIVRDEFLPKWNYLVKCN